MITTFRILIAEWMILLIHTILPRKYLLIADIVDTERMFRDSSEVIIEQVNIPRA